MSTFTRKNFVVNLVVKFFKLIFCVSKAKQFVCVLKAETLDDAREKFPFSIEPFMRQNSIDVGLFDFTKNYPYLRR